MTDTDSDDLLWAQLTTSSSAAAQWAVTEILELRAHVAELEAELERFSYADTINGMELYERLPND